jgi:hypothetical protein
MWLAAEGLSQHDEWMRTCSALACATLHADHALDGLRIHLVVRFSLVVALATGVHPIAARRNHLTPPLVVSTSELAPAHSKLLVRALKHQRYIFSTSAQVIMK